jgi:hypothetical protein
MDDYDAYDAILHHLFKVTQGDAWFKSAHDSLSAGVCLRVESGAGKSGGSHFRVFPYENLNLVPFEQAVRSLNPVVAVKVRSAAVHSALSLITEDADAIHIDTNTRIQVIDTMSDLPQADKEQCGAFIRDERVMIIWSDDLDTIIPIYQDFESKLIKLVYSSRASTLFSPAPSTLDKSNAPTANTTASNLNLVANVNNEQSTATEDLNEKAEKTMKERQEGRNGKKTGSKTSWFSWKLSSQPKPSSESTDLETGGKVNKRPIRYFAPVYGGIGAALSVCKSASLSIDPFPSSRPNFSSLNLVSRHLLMILFSLGYPFIRCLLQSTASSLHRQRPGHPSSRMQIRRRLLEISFASLHAFPFLCFDLLLPPSRHQHFLRYRSGGSVP